jgi:hypothetical protein
MKRLPLSSLLCGVALLGLPAPVSAEIFVGESIEWVTATSDRIVVGKVVKVEVEGEKEPVEVATVAVSRTLKGKHADTVRFTLRRSSGPEVARGWQADGVPMLFFLVGEKDWALRYDGNGHCAVLLGKSDRDSTHTMPVLTRDFKVLTEPEAILKRVEGAVAATPKDRKPQRHLVNVRGDSEVFTKCWGGSSVLLVVPVDADLEKQARAWCKSPSDEDRWEGAKVLKHFKNDENVRILKSLLDDPAISVSQTYQQVAGQREPTLVSRTKVYYVRAAAYEALRDFGVEVKKPVLEESLKLTDR